MAKISGDQIDFLCKQKIPLSRVFDASGMTKGEYREIMSDLELLVAYGVTACKAFGHTLRTRSGHCCQCNTASLAFLLRFEEPGILYVASSKKIGLIKIGVAKDCTERLRNLNGHGYGGANDWDVCFSREVDSAGRLEFRVQTALQMHKVVKNYIRTGRQIECQELFSCDANMAIDAINQINKHNFIL